MIRLLILVFLINLPLRVIACSCYNFWGPVTIKDYNENEFVILGTAIKVTVDENETVDRQRQIDFEIKELFKGKGIGGTIKIYTSLGDASCGLYVGENEDWIIWAYLQDGVVTTNLCTRSKKRERVTETDLKSLKYFRSGPSKTDWRNEAEIRIAEGKLEDNEPIGRWKYFYTNGFIEAEGTYLHGKPNGKWTSFLNPDGILTRLRYDKVIPGDSTPDMEIFKYKPREIHYYKEGVRDGEFVYYSYSSIDKPKKIVNYKNGNLDGKSIAYHNNGIIHYEQNYKSGELDGYERFYYANGHLKQSGQFVNGKATGEFKLFNEEGKLIKTSVDRRPE